MASGPSQHVPGRLGRVGSYAHLLTVGSRLLEAMADGMGTQEQEWQGDDGDPATTGVVEQQRQQRDQGQEGHLAAQDEVASGGAEVAPNQIGELILLHLGRVGMDGLDAVAHGDGGCHEMDPAHHCDVEDQPADLKVVGLTLGDHDDSADGDDRCEHRRNRSLTC
ncbi:MAG TPA: hypothetical protein VK694_01495 [Verrucomicrobiae bacterium]|nr:hypothetical protein [Verrucomicrobiae bacterium]